MAVTNLSQYYQSLGQALPTVSARAPIYASYGYSDPYTGSLNQNVNLLAKLQAGPAAPAAPSAPAAPAAPAVAPAAGSVPSPTDYLKSAGDELSKTVTQQGTDLTNFLGGQANDLKNYQDTTNSKYNVPALSDAATALQNRVTALRTNAGNVASGYNSENQVNNLLDNRFNPALTEATNSSQNAEKLAQGDITNFINQQLTATNAYTTGQKNQLDTLVAKFQTGAQLTSDEWKEMQTLADNEANRLEDIQKTQLVNANNVQTAQIGANAQLGAAGISAAASKANAALSNRYQNLGNGLLYDTQTGQTIGTPPAAVLTPPSSSTTTAKPPLSSFMLPGGK